MQITTKLYLILVQGFTICDFDSMVTMRTFHKMDLNDLNQKFVHPLGILIVNICLIFVPIISTWDIEGMEKVAILSTDAFPSNKIREAMIFSLTLSVPELLGCSMDTRFDTWMSFLRAVFLVSGSIANVVLLVAHCSPQFILLAIHLKLLFSILTTFLNILFMKKYLIPRLMFHLLLFSFTIAISTSCWLLYTKSSVGPFVTFCFFSYGLSACIFVYYMYIWLRTLAKSYGNLTLDQLHTSVDLVATFLIFIGQMSITFAYYSNSSVNSFEFYTFYSILLVSILMHIAWFCHNQIHRMEIDRVYVSDTTL